MTENPTFSTLDRAAPHSVSTQLTIHIFYPRADSILDLSARPWKEQAEHYLRYHVSRRKSIFSCFFYFIPDVSRDLRSTHERQELSLLAFQSKGHEDEVGNLLAYQIDSIS